MSLRNDSVATVAAPEFIEITPYNELISECEIKVLYLGENRNHSFITKEVATQMANSLPGMPIVAAYRPEIEDFGDHGHKITIENGDMTVECTTVPYGFVAPDAKVWFQKFIDTDHAGNQIEREYMMTTGYLWTGQYPEIQKAIDEGLPQSMELNDDISGYWATNNKSGIDFFIINDATFTKLCILGSDVEPCFEGASVTAPNVSKQFTLDDAPKFVKDLLSMKNELNYALQNKGGSSMDEEVMNEEITSEETPITTFDDASEGEADSAGDASETVDGEGEDTVEDDSSEEAADEEQGEEEAPEQEEITVPEPEETEIPSGVPETEEEDDCGCDDIASRARQNFVKEDDEEEKEDDSKAEDSDEDSEDEEDEKEPSKNHSLEEVEAEFAELQSKYETVCAELVDAHAELESLREFKLGIDNQRKDEEIAKYHMLSDEDKAEIINNKSNYSLDEIKSKLAVLYVEKNVVFDTLTGEVEKQEEIASPITTFSLDDAPEMNFSAPSWVQSMLDARNN